jgi:hypothetical protein
MAGASVETTLEHWASSLRDVKRKRCATSYAIMRRKRLPIEDAVLVIDQTGFLKRCKPTRAGGAEAVQPNTRPPRFQRDPFPCDGVFDHGRVATPSIAVPFMSPSARPTPSAPAIFPLSRLNNPPHAIVVDASGPPSPTGSRNTHYQAGATPYLCRIFHRWIASASPGAPEVGLVFSS